MDKYDDPDDPDAEDQIVFDRSAWSAMHRLHERWQNNPQSLAFPPLGEPVEKGKYQFRMRFGDLDDALVALTLKRKPLPLQFELLPGRLRLSVSSEHGLVAQVDAPLISRPFADSVCVEGVQQIMVQLPRLRHSVDRGAELDCEIDLDRRHLQLNLPRSLGEQLDAPPRRGRKRRNYLQFGISVPSSREARPWEALTLGEGRPIDVEAVARVLACAHRLMAHQTFEREDSGIDVSDGRAVAGNSIAFYCVSDPSLSALAFRVAPSDSVRLQGALRRMSPDRARHHASSTSDIFTDGVLICAIGRPKHPFPALARALNGLSYDEVCVTQDKGKPFYGQVQIILGDRQGDATARLYGCGETLRACFEVRVQSLGPVYAIDIYPSSLSDAIVAHAVIEEDEVIAVDAELVDTPAVIDHKVVLDSRLAYRVLTTLPNGPVSLRFVGSRALLVYHEAGSMRATAFFASKAVASR
ncbi:hypothetical protein [Methylobacterium sp. WL8]|uniref:hypothetical protein n=1 Tax=Methylobacterium sp. WL8 TaxID=2603899 RepID=UPI0011C9C718|nr:hypothetical protein [Methylobacterium sp. WL8]TXN82700.1 hypothetical protein FV234_09160 [Methylobacterium sp. WL8]